MPPPPGRSHLYSTQKLNLWLWIVALLPSTHQTHPPALPHALLCPGFCSPAPWLLGEAGGVRTERREHEGSGSIPPAPSLPGHLRLLVALDTRLPLLRGAWLPESFLSAFFNFLLSCHISEQRRLFLPPPLCQSDGFLEPSPDLANRPFIKSSSDRLI